MPSPRTLQKLAALALAAALAASPALATPKSAELARSHLYNDTLAEGAKALAAADTADADARFGLGIVQFTHAVEHLGQNLHRYGLRPPKMISVPLLRLPVPPNPSPEELTYDGFRAVLQDFADDLAVAEAALAKVGDGKTEIVLDLAKIRMDITGKAKHGGGETMAALLKRMGDRNSTDAPASLEVKFDTGDAAWLRGYCHVLMALSQFVLAHDFHTTFDTSFQLFFPRTVSPFRAALALPMPRDTIAGEWRDAPHFADFVSFIHTMNWPVADAARMKAVRAHLKSVVAASRESWKLILAETGDDREWLPNPRQTHAALGEKISQPQLDSWFGVLDEAEAILDGRKLVPHWRFAKGMDFKRFFEEPQTFDLVMLLAGSGAVPYLADGELTTKERWDELTRAFEGSFFGYAIWIN